MAQARVSGVFMGAHLRESNFEGNKKVSVIIDVYQPNSPAKNKTINIKSDDVEDLKLYQDTFEFGQPIELDVIVSAYRNEAYFRLAK